MKLEYTKTDRQYEVSVYTKIVYEGGGIAQLVSCPPLKLGDLGSNPGGGLTRVIQCMDERGRDYQL